MTEPEWAVWLDIALLIALFPVLYVGAFVLAGVLAFKALCLAHDVFYG